MISGSEIKIDESSITGESDYIKKNTMEYISKIIGNENLGESINIPILPIFSAKPSNFYYSGVGGFSIYNNSLNFP